MNSFLKKILAVGALVSLSACTFIDNFDEDLMAGSAEKGPESSSDSTDVKDSSDIKDSVVFKCGENVARGNQEYKTVKIKDQCWIAENMNYKPSKGESACYDDDDSNCEKFGRLYNYEAAEVACPSGWRLPEESDFQAVLDYTGLDADDAGKLFKSTSGWDGESGTDDFGFNALPAGVKSVEGNFIFLNQVTRWWSSTEATRGNRRAVELNSDSDYFSFKKVDEVDEMISVRCIMK